MPRSRGSEMPQRPSPRIPLQLRTSSSESDGHHPLNRPLVDRSPKLGDRRSPRAPVTEKKRGSRIADLEAQLGQTQEEVKKLKEQLAASEAAKKEAQQKELEKNRAQTLVENSPQPQISVDSSAVTETPEENPNEETSPETDVFEVPVLMMPADQKPGPVHAGTPEQEKRETAEATHKPESLVVPEKPMIIPENAELSELKAKLAAKEKELERLDSENEELKKQVSEAAADASAARAKAEEAALKLTRMGEELDEAKGKVARTKADLEVVEVAKASLEAEMKRLRVQTEQWRKAADAAAAVLAGGVDMHDGRRMAERCGSMDKHLGGFDAPDGYPGLGSPMMGDDMDDGFGGGKRKGTGIRMFGDLWKKKGQK
ncbi:hypothetical protein H6P81_014173 [Aristolochia fimbriata]|uniref:Interactor of constitutive active ROPs 1 n=1 Tax=Aristolochia fimbriata TaxID=158543 RepID=A0AAV7EIW7_ARIFI|nr:hypothetical protein H6P81_014173 [Aristolochia fimbriata]